MRRDLFPPLALAGAALFWLLAVPVTAREAGDQTGRDTAAAGAGGAATADTTADRLLSALEENRHALALEGGELTGPGGPLLLEEAADARYLLVGETHGVAELPGLIAALFRQLQPAGYRHLAVEIGPIQAEKLADVLAGPAPMEGYRRFLDEHWPGVPFFGWREEAGLLAEAVRVAGEEALWGIDYDILGGRYPLHRLRELAPDAAARAAVDRLIERADSLLARASETGEPSTIMMFSQPAATWDSLRRSFEPAAGSEADRILEQLAATARINEAWTAGERWLSNRRRVALLKHNLLGYRRQAAPDAKVIVKMGGYHLTRGRTPNNTHDVGNLLSELSWAEGGPSRGEGAALTVTGSRSFHVMALGGPGRTRGALDPEGWGVREAPTVLSSEDYWARPLAEAALEDRWTLFDLRPLRPLADAGELGDLPARFEETIFGYDAVLVLVGSTPAGAVEIERRQ